MSRLVVGDLCFELRRSARRRTLEITVDRGGELVLSAPIGAKETRLRDFVRRKRMWVYRQLARKEALLRPIPRKAFVDGEGFLYLGRSYRLRLITSSGSAAPVRLERGRLMMPRTLAANGRVHLRRWYVERATPWLLKRVRDYADRMEVMPTAVSVQDLGYRWGSCGKSGRLYFHWKTILLPARIAEYVVVHEMAHLHEPHHIPAFWRRVERALPDYNLRKEWLAEHGIDVEGH
ncbi:MAG: M48 family metallopeptidase [Rhodanobacteraceae bacterium]